MAQVKKEKFCCLPTGENIHKYTLTNALGTKVELIDYGATLIGLFTRDKYGNLEDIVLGCSERDGYLLNPPYFGSTIGRVANRISHGQFTLDGQKYQLDVNCGVHHLHGGLKGFSKQLWAAEVKENGESLSVMFKLTSKDGEDRYPGTVDTTVTYTVTNDNELTIQYTALVREKATIINLTNHAYFNLAGQGSQNVLDHVLQINADAYLPSDSTCCPTGEKRSVLEDGGIFDFRKAKPIGQDIAKVEGNGYDHTFCLQGDVSKCCARVTHPSSGRTMEVYTDQPGVQLYTMNISEPMKGKNTSTYSRHSAFCLETQNYPNAINQDNFPSCILRPGDKYYHETTYKFSVSQ